MVAVIVILYVLVALGSLVAMRSWYRGDVELARRSGGPPPWQGWYVLTAIGWPMLWLILPVALIVIGAIEAMDPEV